MEAFCGILIDVFLYGVVFLFFVVVVKIVILVIFIDGFTSKAI